MKFVVIGAGLVGLATAYALAKNPRHRVVVLDKEPGPGRHQSSHNSGVLHAGLYYKPGSLKARLAVRGIQMMSAFCVEHGIPHEICGKLVVATNPLEKERLLRLAENGRANGLAGLQLLELPEMREIEPEVAGQCALRVPQEGIVDYPAVIRRLTELLREQGHELLFDCRALGCRPESNGWTVETTQGDLSADFYINCGGLQCDRIAAFHVPRPALRIIPFRGEYYRLQRPQLVRHLIYPVPDPAYPFLGVHFSRLIHGGVEAGPNAVLALGREAYRAGQLNAVDFWEAATFPGLWRFLAAHGRMCGFELLQSFSRRLFCQSLQRLVPGVQESDLVAGGTGVRAQAMLPNGTLVQDFSLREGKRCLDVLNAPSPAATASLAIGEYIAEQVSRSVAALAPASSRSGP